MKERTLQSFCTGAAKKYELSHETFSEMSDYPNQSFILGEDEVHLSKKCDSNTDSLN